MNYVSYENAVLDTTKVTVWRIVFCRGVLATEKLIASYLISGEKKGH